MSISLRKTVFAILILGLVVSAALAVANVAQAAMPNFVGDDYKQPDQCIPHVDHPVYEIVDGKATVTGCITGAAWDRSIAEARELQETGFHFAAGEFVTLLSGAVEQCPAWYNVGCVISHALIR